MNALQSHKKPIILIGIPACGKSTVGVLLAKRLGYRFVDSDLYIQEAEGKLLQDIINEQGMEGFIKIEEKSQSRSGYTRQPFCDRDGRKRRIQPQGHGAFP